MSSWFNAQQGGAADSVSDRAITTATALITFFTCLLAIACLYWTLLVWYRYHPHIPWRDIYLILADFISWRESDAKLASLTTLFDLHYGAHRIAVMRLLVALDVSLLSGQNHLLYAAGWLSLVLMLTLYSTKARDFFNGARNRTLFVTALAALVFFSPAHVWNLLNPVNSSWLLTLLFSMTAFLVLLRRRDTPRLRDWTVAYLLATLAAFCTFGGVLCWLLLPIVALCIQVRAVAPTAVLSVAGAWLYSHGAVSDAAVALAWDVGSKEVVEQAQVQATAALDAQSVLSILGKVASLLTWPFAENHKPAATVLATLSWVMLGAFWLWYARLAIVRKSRPHVWIELCLLCAALCIAIAVASQFGRILPRANNMLGPSLERYQTLVALYWVCLFGLLLGVSHKLPRFADLLSMLFCSGVAMLLVAPSGAYLKQEIRGAEYAASLYMLGERPQLRDKGIIPSRYNPEYIFTFDPFFAANKLAYRVVAGRFSVDASIPECDAREFSFSLVASDLPGVQTINGQLGAHYRYITREITLSANEQLVGRLYPRHSGDFSPLALLNAGSNAWRGLLEGGKLDNGQALVVVTTLIGTQPLCRLHLSE